ncbi:MAG TPA: CHAD domain-containing protein [Solirubrobacterales bacterium]|nr:CHAD domain-containing protein [Solirubrobacterales bacterium]
MSPEVADRSYRFHYGESLGEGARRIAAGRAGKAAERLRAIGSGEVEADAGIHGARKDLKKLRTLLRLLRDELPQAVYTREARRYRDAARLLSPLRDAEVKLGTLQALDLGELALPAEATAAWERILDRDRRAAGDAVPDRAAEAQAVELIEAGRDGVEDWGIRDSWKAIGPGLDRVYRRGRRRMRSARDEYDEEAWHEWRKRAKDLWYAHLLLAPAWPGPLGASAEEAHRLSEALGDHHDLALLRADLRQRRLGEEETRALEAAIGRRQEELAATALDLGHRLYAERPRDFSRRLRRYWRAWRG